MPEHAIHLLEAMSMSAPASRPAQTRRGFAFPPRLLVGIVFMTQFIALMIGVGGYVPTLHEQGISTLILVLGSVAAFAGFQVVLGFLLRFIPVRCRCQNRAYFGGFGWWPFTYRFRCPDCGTELRIEVQGR